MRIWPFGRRQVEERQSLEDPRVPLHDLSALNQLFNGRWAASSSGVTVTVDTALGVPAFWCGVNFLAGTLAALPLNLYRRTEDGRERAERNPLHAILHDAPNSEWTSFRWRKHSMVNVLTKGRSFTFIERDGAGRVTNLWPLEPDATTVERRNGVTTYRYTGSTQNGQPARYSAGEIIDIPWMLASDGYSHHGPVERLKQALGLAIAIEDYGARFFANGGVPPLSLEGPFQSPQAIQRASKELHDAIQGAASEGRKVLPMPSGHALKAIGLDPVKGQMIEVRRFQIEEIARVLDLPPVFLQDLTHGTYSNTEQQDLHFVKHTLTQWLKAWEQELNLKLFSSRNRRNFVEFNVDGLLRGDFASRMSGYATAVQNAIRTPNEVRALENLPDDPEGGALLIQGATTPLGSQPSPAGDGGLPDD